jgi:hypothetical protein
MALTKEHLTTYHSSLVEQRQQAFNAFHEIGGGIQVVEKLLKFLELEGSDGSVTPSDLGLSGEATKE